MHWCWQLANRERLQKGWTFECLILQAIEKDQLGKPFEWQRLGEDSDSIISSELMVTSFPEHMELPGSLLSKLAMPPPGLILTGAELLEDRTNSNAPYLVYPWPLASLCTWSCQGPHCTSSRDTFTPSPHWGRSKSSRYKIPG